MSHLDIDYYILDSDSRRERPEGGRWTKRIFEGNSI